CMLSSNPARALGRNDLGRLAAGYLADMVLLDEQLNVRMALVSGRVVFGG
ncbi:MAG: N-acetylglucosamine-6-phosphate deacetylase, partial [Chloroflexota bacterium]